MRNDAEAAACCPDSDDGLSPDCFRSPPRSRSISSEESCWFAESRNRKRSRQSSGSDALGEVVLKARAVWSDVSPLDSSHWTPDGVQTKTAPKAPTKKTDGRISRRLSMNGLGLQDSAPVGGLQKNASAPAMLNVDYQKLTEAMVRKGVRLLALDWDLTMVSCHTQSRWYGSPNELAKFLRPSMALLASAAATSGLRIAIVTFSGQCERIRRTLAIVLPQIASTVVVRCSDKQWKVSDASLRGFFPAQSTAASPAKLKHIYSAVQQFESQMTGGSNKNSHLSGDSILPENIVFIDDSRMNIATACYNGVNAIQMEPDNPEATLLALMRIFLLEIPSCRCELTTSAKEERAGKQKKKKKKSKVRRQDVQWAT